MANVICDGSSKECLKGEDYGDCNWCHGICLESKFIERFHHDDQCDSLCGKHEQCTYFEFCSLKG